MDDLFVFVEILNYIEKNNIRCLDKFISVVCIKKNIWFEVVYKYLDVFVDYFKEIENTD